jgi:hypothetical protein
LAPFYELFNADGTIRCPETFTATFISMVQDLCWNIAVDLAGNPCGLTTGTTRGYIVLNLGIHPPTGLQHSTRQVVVDRIQAAFQQPVRLPTANEE